MTKFRTIDEAISRGYVLAEVRQYQPYRGCYILGYDTSGRGFKGYSFGLRVEVPEDFTANYLGVFSERTFGTSVEVKITGPLGRGHGAQALFNRPKDGERGVQMFTRLTYESALVAAREWTDAWFRAHPEAVSRMNERILTSRRRA